MMVGESAVVAVLSRPRRRPMFRRRARPSSVRRCAGCGGYAGGWTPSKPQLAARSDELRRAGQGRGGGVAADPQRASQLAAGAAHLCGAPPFFSEAPALRSCVDDWRGVVRTRRRVHRGDPAGQRDRAGRSSIVSRRWRGWRRRSHLRSSPTPAGASRCWPTPTGLGEFERSGGLVGCVGSSTKPAECSSSRASSTRSWEFGSGGHRPHGGRQLPARTAPRDDP